jgi:hypothetical protein
MRVFSWLNRTNRFSSPTLFTILVLAGCLIAPAMASAVPTIQTTTTVSCGSAVLFPGSEATCAVKSRSSGAGPAPTGTVKLTAEGGQVPASCTLVPFGAEGICAVRYTAKQGGLQKVSASYQGDLTHLASAGQTTVIVSTTATVLNCQPNSPTVGEPTTCTAEAKNTGGASASVSGTVSFKSVGEGQLNRTSCTLEDNACSVKYTPKATGDHLVTASYGGDPTHPGSGAETTLSAHLPTTITTVSCGTGVRFPGVKVLCTVRVRGSGPAPTAPTGTVKLTAEGGQITASCTLLPFVGPERICQGTYTTHVAGLQTISASYPGDSTHLASSGKSTVAVSDTSTSLICDPESPVVGEASTCIAEVKNFGPAPEEVSGTVRFESSGEAEQLEPTSCTLEQNVCSVKFSPKASGVYRITATYEGDATHPSSQAEAGVAARGLTETELRCGSVLRFPGDRVGCLVISKGLGPKATAPTGRIKVSGDGFRVTEGSTNLGECTLIPLTEVNKKPESAAECIIVPEKGGQLRATASYPGDRTHLPSSGGAVVPVTDTATSLTCDQEKLAVGEASTCVAEVRNAGVASDSLTGTIGFVTDRNGHFEPGFCNVEESRICTVKYFPGVGGDHRFTATYEGDETHPASHDQVTFAVRGTSVRLTCAHPTEALYEPARCVAHVVNEGLGSKNLTGTVHFSSSSEGKFSSGGECTLFSLDEEGGVCDVNYTPEAAGAHVIRAIYSGDDTHPQAIDGKSQVNVRARPTTTTVTCTGSPLTGDTQCLVRVRDNSPTQATPPVSGVQFFSAEDKDFVFGSADQVLFACDLSPVSSVESTCSFKQGLSWRPNVFSPQLMFARYQGVEAPPRAVGLVDKVHAPSEATIRLIYGTKTEVDCGDSATVGQAKRCTATVRTLDPEPHPSEGGPTPPTGPVRFSSPASGTFSRADCTLEAIGPDASRCSVFYTPQAEGNHPITASYPNDAHHDSSFDTKNLGARSG